MWKRLFHRIYSFFNNEWAILIAICINGLILFMLAFKDLRHNQPLEIADYGFTLFFVIEMIVKISYQGRKQYFSWGWNKFDFIIVMLSIPSMMEMVFPLPDVSFVLAFRIVRVIRIFRFFKFIPNLRQMITGLGRALRASVFVLFALLVYNFILAVLSAHVFADYAPKYFADPVTAFYTIFQIFTVEGWNEIPDYIAATNPGPIGFFAKGFFIMVVLTGGILGFSIVNAIFVDEMVVDNTDALEEKIDGLNTKVDRLLEELAKKD